MDEPDQTRRLIAIMAADVAGYSRLMGDDERATVQTLTEYRKVFGESVARHRGHIVDTAGDSVLATFDSPVEAVECAISIQHELARRNRQLADHRQMKFRIGINLGDVIIRDDGTVYGDGVNVAARLESLAEPGGTVVSGTVFDLTESKLPVAFQFQGAQSVKNIAKPVRAYGVLNQAVSSDPSAPIATAQPARRSGRRGRIAVALGLIAVVVTGGWWATHARREMTAKAFPAVAVLAFANLSSDPKQEIFSDGLAENIIDNLAQVKELKVIARNSSFRYKGQAVDARKIGQELGANYLIEGSVRRSDDAVRVSAQLVETGSGSSLWSKTFERSLTPRNVFSIEDDIANAIVTTIAGFYGVLHQEDLALAKRKPPGELSSYECVLLGMEYYKRVSLTTFRSARDCAQKAVEVDPEYAALWNLLAIVSRAEFQFGFDPKPGSLDRALDAAERALKFAPSNAEYQAEVAVIHSFRGELSAFKTAAERAVELAPRGSPGFANLGVHLCYAGEWEKGLQLIERAKGLDPFYPGWYHVGAFHDHYRRKQYEEALNDANRINIPNYVQALSMTVAALGQLGHGAEAQDFIRKIQEIDPNFDARQHWAARFRFQPDHLEHLLDGMRKGGMRIRDAHN